MGLMSKVFGTKQSKANVAPLRKAPSLNKILSQGRSQEKFEIPKEINSYQAKMKQENKQAEKVMKEGKNDVTPFSQMEKSSMEKETKKFKQLSDKMMSQNSLSKNVSFEQSALLKSKDNLFKDIENTNKMNDKAHQELNKIQSQDAKTYGGEVK